MTGVANRQSGIDCQESNNTILNNVVSGNFLQGVRILTENSTLIGWFRWRKFGVFFVHFLLLLLSSPADR
jgi:parallel beta-helix repeat protein